MGDDEFYKLELLKEVRDSARALEDYADELIEKLAECHETLNKDQRASLRESFGKRSTKHGGWFGWSRRHHLRHEQQAA